MATGKCPKCDKVVHQAHFEAINVHEKFGRAEYHGVSYLCPHCSTVLSVAIDPIAIRTDIVNAVKKALGRS